MTPEEITQIILDAFAELPIQVDNVHLHFHWGGQDEVPPLEGPPEEALIIVEMTDSCALFKVSRYNEAGFPIMENAGIRKILKGERLEVLAQKLRADGGIYWWEVWRGKDNDTSIRGYYVRVDKTEVV